MKRKQMLMILAMATVTAMAQTNEGGISIQMLDEIKKSQTNTPAERALKNAIAGNSIDNLAKNYNAGEIDTHFTIETPKQSITDQIGRAHV